jgi:CheY-like chemotaxis protein
MTQNESVLRAVGGGFRYEEGEGGPRYSFWLPLSIEFDGRLIMHTRSEQREVPRSGHGDVKQPEGGVKRWAALLIMHDPPSQQRVADLLSAEGCEVCMKSNGQQGLQEYLRSLRGGEEKEGTGGRRGYDFVLVDLLSPVMHGGEFLAGALKAQGQGQGQTGLGNTTFIGMATADNSGDRCCLFPVDDGGGSEGREEVREGGREVSYGFTHILQKPVTAGALHAVLHAHLDTECSSDAITSPVRRRSQGFNWLLDIRKMNNKVHPDVDVE